MFLVYLSFIQSTHTQTGIQVCRGEVRPCARRRPLPPARRSCRSPKRALSNKNNIAFRDALFVLIIIMATSFLVISSNNYKDYLILHTTLMYCKLMTFSHTLQILWASRPGSSDQQLWTMKCVYHMRSLWLGHCV